MDQARLELKKLESKTWLTGEKETVNQNCSHKLFQNIFEWTNKNEMAFVLIICPVGLHKIKKDEKNKKVLTSEEALRLPMESRKGLIALLALLKTS